MRFASQRDICEQAAHRVPSNYKSKIWLIPHAMLGKEAAPSFSSIASFRALYSRVQ
jgi:hypothetical protein